MNILLNKRGLGILLAVLVLSYFAWQPLVHQGYFVMHDDQQVARLAQLDKSLSAGQFPVRWVPDLGFGLGYPLFNFYPPLVYYLGEAVHLFLGTGFLDSTKIVWFLALAGSVVSMYLLAKELFGRIGGGVAALFYLYAPYHAVDAYVRGALAELFSFVWLPLILLTSYKLIKEGKWQWAVLTGIFFALLMITHNLVFLPFFGVFSLWYVLIYLIYGKGNIKLFAFSYLLLTFITFSLTAFFWLPALTEKQDTLVDQLLIKNLASYRIHFVCPEQLWNSLWGYGGSGPGCLDGMSFKIGKLHLILAFLSLPAAIWLWLRKRKKAAGLLFSLFLLLIFSAWMTTAYSGFIWDNLPPLWYLQFPWRFLEFTALFASLLAGSLFLLLNKFYLKILTAIVVLAGLLFYNAKLFVPQKYLTAATDNSLLTDQQVKWHVSNSSFEYLPFGIATKISPLGTVLVDINENEVVSPSWNEKFRILSGDFTPSSSQFAPDRFLLSGNSAYGAQLQFHLADFPGWKVWIDNKPAAINDANQYKLISVMVPPGNHGIAGKFTNTPVRTAGNTLSLISLGGLAVLIYGIRRNKK